MMHTPTLLALSGLPGSSVVSLMLFGIVALALAFYYVRLSTLSRQVWDDYGIQLKFAQVLSLLRREVLQIVGGKQLRYDSARRRVILS